MEITSICWDSYQKLHLWINDNGPGGDPVCTNVGIGTQPSNVTVAAGTTATFSITSSGTLPSYQWQRSTDGGTNWANVTDGTGGTSASYTTPATTTAMSGYKYRCVISNSCPSSVTSNAASLTVTATGGGADLNRQIDMSESDGASNGILLGSIWGEIETNNEYLYFNAVDLGTGASSIQVAIASKNAGDLADLQIRSGGPNGTLLGTITNATGTGGWSTYKTFTCPLSSASGTMNIYLKAVNIDDNNFNVAWMKFVGGSSCTNVSIDTQPSNVTAAAGATATFSITSSGTLPSYQWQRSTDGGTSWANVTDGTGGTSASYTTPATTTAMSGYKYRCVISNSCPSSATSNAATLTVTATGGGADLNRQIDMSESDGASNGILFGSIWGEIETNNEYLYFNAVDLGTGASSIQVAIASKNAGDLADLQIHSGGPNGTLLGTITNATGTGGWSTYKTFTCPLSSASGTINIYLKAVNIDDNNFNVAWMKFLP